MSQVVFIHDYIQLVFQTATFSIYNSSSIEFDEKCVAQGSAGFADQLVQQIGRQAEVRSGPGEQALILLFESGLSFKVKRRDEENPGQQSFEVHTDTGDIIMEMNE